MKNAKWLSLTYNKTVKLIKFHLFKLDFEFRISKKVYYSGDSKIGKLGVSLKTGTVGSISGVKFYTTEKKQ